MKATIRSLAASLMLAAAILAPATVGASWMMIAEEQHALKADCPKGLVLVSIEAGDADLLVCVPSSAFTPEPEPEQAKLPDDDEGPLEGPKFN